MRFLLFSLSLSLSAQTAPAPILGKLAAVQAANDKRAEQYAYSEDTERYAIGKDGAAHLKLSTTHEVIFVEGLRYRKLVSRNGAPLSAKEKAEVAKAMSETAAERRRTHPPAPPGGRITLRTPLHTRTADLGSIAELLTLFECRSAGEEDVRGRKAWIVECTPKPGAAATEHDRQVQVFRRKFWVDQQDNVLARALYTVDRPHELMQPGSNMLFEFEKVDDTWQAVRMTIEFTEDKQKEYHPTQRTVYRETAFRKFDVQSTVTPIER